MEIRKLEEIGINPKDILIKIENILKGSLATVTNFDDEISSELVDEKVEDDVKRRLHIFKNIYTNKLNDIQKILLLTLFEHWYENREFKITISSDLSKQLSSDRVSLPNEFLEFFKNSKAHQTTLLFIQKFVDREISEGEYIRLVILLLFEMEKIFTFIKIDHQQERENVKERKFQKEIDALKRAFSEYYIVNLENNAISQILDPYGERITQSNILLFITGKWIPLRLRKILQKQFRIIINKAPRIYSKWEYSFILQSALKKAFPNLKFSIPENLDENLEEP